MFGKVKSKLTLQLITAGITGAVMIALAGLVWMGKSTTTLTLEAYGVPRSVIVGLLTGGGLLLLLRPRDHGAFILGTLPFLFYVIGVVFHILMRGGAWSPALLYGYTFYLMHLVYHYQRGCA